MTTSPSFFTSPGFILTEISFIIVASIAAYELLVGDFIWAQQEEARQAAQLEQQAQQRSSSHGRGYAGRTSIGGGGYYKPASSRRGSSSAQNNNDETSYLLYPSHRSNTNNNNNNRDATNNNIATEEQGYYTTTSPRGGSAGDKTRRLFYKMAFFALLSRFILLPLETYCLAKLNDSTIPTYISTLRRILLRLSQTLPDVVLASALGLLVIFCIKIAFAALPPLTPDSHSREGSVHGGGGDGEDTAKTVDTIKSEEGNAQPNNKRQESTSDDGPERTIRNLMLAQTWYVAAARLSKTILASNKTFHVWNSILSISYTLVFVAALIIPHAPLSHCEVFLWILMTSIYSLLMLILIYAMILLGKALHSGLSRRENGSPLAFRLICTLTLLAGMFIERLLRFGFLAHNTIINLDESDSDESIQSIYTRHIIEYASAESLPMLLILIMMHRKRKETEIPDVHIMHSIINNILGSTGRLSSFSGLTSDNNNIANASVRQGPGDGSTRVCGLGSRRQTYGGTSGTSRGESFPPASAANHQSRLNMNIPRATTPLANPTSSIVNVPKGGGGRQYVPAPAR